MTATADLDALETTARDGETCGKCLGDTRGYEPHCPFCSDSTHDHECPPRRPCDCDGGKRWHVRIDRATMLSLLARLRAIETAAQAVCALHPSDALSPLRAALDRKAG